MSYMALYREWRPSIFEDLVGQDAIVRTLKNQIASDRIPHAYLFCGTRGTGKTSTAKILSKAVNCLNPQDGDPCNECEMCREINSGTLIDVVEIDAASNNKVENIRDIIEDVKYPPHSSKYKVYIIDEVHMLSISAFNALLKTLEEPPRHVIFILATTDPQKVPATILSRCQRFDFKRINTLDAVGRLRQICDDKNIDVEDRVLNLIARTSDGAMRDAVSLLDQCIGMSNESIEYENVCKMLGLTSNEYIFSLTDAMIKSEVDSCIKIIDEVILNGKDTLQFIKDITKHFRNLLMTKLSKNPSEIIDAGDETIKRLKEQSSKINSEEIMRGINILTEAESNAKLTSQQRIILEISAIKFCKRQYDTSKEMILNRLRNIENALKSGKITLQSDDKNENVNKNSEVNTAPLESLENIKPKHVRQKGNFTVDEVKNVWQDVMSYLSANKNKVVSVLLAQGTIVGIDGNTIEVQFDTDSAISKKILEEGEKKAIAEEAFSSVLKSKVKLSFQVANGDNSIDESIRIAKELFGEDIVEVRNN